MAHRQSGGDGERQARNAPGRTGEAEQQAPARRAARRGGGRPTIADVAQARRGRRHHRVASAARAGARIGRSAPADRGRGQELGYVPDTNARALASARAEVCRRAGAVADQQRLCRVVRGIYDGLSDTDFQIQIGNTHYSGMEEERLLKVFLGQRPAALIVSGIDQTPAARRLLEGAGCPVVQIMETGPDPIDMMVGFSHLDGGRTATQHLIDGGYRRIGFIGARMDPRSQRRLAGYRAGDGGCRPRTTRVWSSPRRSRRACRSAASCFATRWPRRRSSTPCSATMTTLRSACCSNATAPR